MSRQCSRLRTHSVSSLWCIFAKDKCHHNSLEQLVMPLLLMQVQFPCQSWACWQALPQQTQRRPPGAAALQACLEGSGSSPVPCQWPGTLLVQPYSLHTLHMCNG